jgi:hypothetical protein
LAGPLGGIHLPCLWGCSRHAQAEASEQQPYTGGDGKCWINTDEANYQWGDCPAPKKGGTTDSARLVEGATGKNRICNDYDVGQQRCRVWAHTVHHSAPKKSGERLVGHLLDLGGVW